jgi:ubiquinone biosynthesis monooxygenase Coq7
VRALARDAEVRAFAQHHLATEARHLALIEQVVPPAGRSRLLPLWRVAGWFAGALPARLGRARCTRRSRRWRPSWTGTTPSSWT